MRDEDHPSLGVQRIVVTYIDRWREPTVALVPLSKIGFTSPQVLSPSRFAEAAPSAKSCSPDRFGIKADSQSLPQRAYRLEPSIPVGLLRDSDAYQKLAPSMSLALQGLRVLHSA